MRRHVVPILCTLFATATPAWSQAKQVAESEPNNTPAQATRAAVGDTLIGTISSQTDVDFFALDISAGALVTLHAGQRVCLIDRDGVVPLQCNSEDYGASFPFMTAGRYYIRVDGSAHHMGEPIIGPYHLIVQADTFSLGAGDPVRRVVDVPWPTRSNGMPDRSWRLAAGLSGELYIGTLNRVLRVNPNGDTTTLASGLWLSGDMVVNPFGEVVLAGGTDTIPTSLLKVSPTGKVSRFTTSVVIGGIVGLPDQTSLAVGPDGDLWAGTGKGIVHLDPLGAKIGEIPLKFANRLAVGSAGELYVAGPGPCVDGVYVVRGSDIACSFPNIVRGQLEPQLELAAGSDGSLFVGTHAVDDYAPMDVDEFGRVERFSPGATMAQRYAHVPRLQELTFARDPQGNMTSRLFAIDAGSSTQLVELSGASNRAVGAGFNVRFYHASLDTLPMAAVGTAYNQTLHVTTDAAFLTWTLANGELPPGVILSDSGVLQGTPTSTGSFAFTVRATSGARSWFAAGTMQVIPDVTVAEVSAALLDGPHLDAAKIEFLDQQGNKNGMLDVGDLRALLRARGLLPPH